MCCSNSRSYLYSDVQTLSTHSATHCNTLQCTATHCNTLQHTATHCNIPQHTATYSNALPLDDSICSQTVQTHCNTLQHTATYCNTLQHTAEHCSLMIACAVRLSQHTLQRTATHVLQHTTLQCSQIVLTNTAHALVSITLQHIVTHCSARLHPTTHCSTLQHTYYNTRTATHSNTCADGLSQHTLATLLRVNTHWPRSFVPHEGAWPLSQHTLATLLRAPPCNTR